MGRDAKAAQMREARSRERDLHIPAPVNPERRKAALASVDAYIAAYHGETFYQPSTPVRKEMIDSIFRAIRHKTAEAIAAPRGEGKSTITKVVLSYAILKKLVGFSLIICSTGDFSLQRLADLKRGFAKPKSKAFREDFSEIVIPCEDVQRSALRANSQTVGGDLTGIEWLKDRIIMPRIWLRWCPDCLRDKCSQSKGILECRHCGRRFRPWLSPSAGAIVATQGITGSLRGQNVDDVRPDIVIIDDPDDEESASSPTKTRKATRKINQSIRGLAGPGESLGRVMLCTVINRECVAFKYTDRNLNPAWNGKRFGLIEKWPDRTDLWDRYVELVRQDWEDGDDFARGAHAFYLENRAAMDAGAIVTNPYRFDDAKTPDGSQREVSTLQQCFNIIADIGRGSFDTEYQNDPPDEVGDSDGNLSVAIVTGADAKFGGRLTKRAARQLPDDFECLTAFVDVQGGWLWFSVSAWITPTRREVVDYGSWGREILTADLGIREAIIQRLLSLRDDWRLHPFETSEGRLCQPDIVLVDSGYESEAVYDAVLSIGGNWRASKGDSKYHHPKKAKAGQVIGLEGAPWSISPQLHGAVSLPLILFRPDWWKHRVREAWLVQPAVTPDNAVQLWGENTSQHREFGRQMSSARFAREFDPRTGFREFWVEGKDNHMWDADVGNLVGRSVWATSMHRRQVVRRRYGVLSSKRGESDD